MLMSIRGTLPTPDSGRRPRLRDEAVERFSKSQIVRAGKLVGGAHAEPTAELIEAFNTAHAWRAAHVQPMRLMRAELGRVARKLDGEALTAARLKRMSSIRKKLKANRTLYQIQDISGCRAIMSSIADVRAVQAHFDGGGTRHEVVDRDDYISVPKADGYRSQHLVMKFIGPDELTAGNRLVVELQIRTRLQHAWATAVEAVGFVRRENLKAQRGNPDWLRLFELMSGEIAEEEGCEPPPSCPAHATERRGELRELDDKLGAIKTLDSYKQAIRHAEDYLSLKGHSYLIRYDLESHSVSVSSFSQLRRTMSQYMNSEMFAGDTENAVLVEVDRVEDLRDAYPNYFLDVATFNYHLRKAVTGAPVKMVKGKGPSETPSTKFRSVLEWLRG